MISARVVLLLLPIINTSFIRSSKFRPMFAIAYWFLVSDFILLGWIGQKPVESPYIEIGMGATVFYFLFLLILIPLIGFVETSLIINNDGIEKMETIEKNNFYFGQNALHKEDTLDTYNRNVLEIHPRLWDVANPFEVEDYSKLTKVIFYL
jgi:ubiquinol-cytochrome c reductase cytochrome b subunit